MVAGIAALISPFALYAWVLLSAKLALGGDSPASTTLAVLPGYQTPATSLCDGVLQTAQGLWFFTEGSDYQNKEALNAKPPALDILTLIGEQPEPGAFSSMLGKQNGTIVLTADMKGSVRYSAILPDTPCADVSHDGRTLWLRTTLQLPGEPGDRQLANARSSDHGQSWQLEKQKLSPVADKYPHDYRLIFPSANERWALYEDDRVTPAPLAEGETPNQLLAYSADQGSTWQYLLNSVSLPIPEQYIAPLRPHGEVVFKKNELTLTPLSPDQILLWQSVELTTQTGDQLGDQHTAFTRLVTLNRKGQAWQAAPAVISAPMAFETIQQGSDGQIFAVKSGPGKQPDEIWQFDPVQQRWDKRGDAPNLFAPFPGSSSITSLRAGKGVLLIEVYARHRPGSILPSGREASISATAYFYSTDQGRSWRKFDTRQYETITGFDAQTNRVFRFDDRGQDTVVTAQTLGQ